MALRNVIEIQRYLKGMDYPAKKADLISKAKENNAPADIQEVLEKIEDGEFRTPAEVMKGVGLARRT